MYVEICVSRDASKVLRKGGVGSDYQRGGWGEGKYTAEQGLSDDSSPRGGTICSREERQSGRERERKKGVRGSSGLERRPRSRRARQPCEPRRRRRRQRRRRRARSIEGAAVPVQRRSGYGRRRARIGGAFGSEVVVVVVRFGGSAADRVIIVVVVILCERVARSWIPFVSTSREGGSKGQEGGPAEMALSLSLSQLTSQPEQFTLHQLVRPTRFIDQRVAVRRSSLGARRAQRGGGGGGSRCRRRRFGRTGVVPSSSSEHGRFRRASLAIDSEDELM